MWPMESLLWWKQFQASILCATTKNVSETLPLSWDMLIQNCTSVQLANLLIASNHLDLLWKITPNVLVLAVKEHSNSWGTFPSLTALVMMCSWLPCLLEPLLWTLHYYLSLVTNLALNHRPVNIWLLLKSWNYNTSLSYKTKSTLSLRTREQQGDNLMISRSLWQDQWLRMHPLSQFLLS